VNGNERAPSALERAFYGPDVKIQVPPTREALQKLLAFAQNERLPVVAAGNGAHAGLADPPPPEAIVISTRAFDAIQTYEPDDFTIGVGAGMTCSALRNALAANGQEMGIDIARSAEGTVGGLAAMAPFGPRHGFLGRVATQILGIEGVTGEGKEFRAGGMVVKNVAGYAIDKFLVGALGVGGVLLRVNFKLRPLPARRVLRFVGFDSADAAFQWCRRARRRHLDPSVLCVVSGSFRDDPRWASLSLPAGSHVVAATFEGRSTVVEWQLRESLSLDGAGAPSASLGSDESDRFLDLATVFSEPDIRHVDTYGAVRVSVKPSLLPKLEARVRDWFTDHPDLRASFLADANSGIVSICWNGPEASIDEPVSFVRDAAQTYEGHSRLVFLPPSVRRAWRHVLDPDPNARIAASVLRAFDPASLFRRAEVGS
jgi:FAD/FMN-containing dehydrogenase